MLRMFIFLAMTATASAHEFHTLTVDNFVASDISPNRYEVTIRDTVAGEWVVCAIYTSDGKIAATQTAVTDNLATTVFMKVTSGEPVHSVQCVRN